MVDIESIERPTAGRMAGLLVAVILLAGSLGLASPAEAAHNSTGVGWVTYGTWGIFSVKGVAGYATYIAPDKQVQVYGERFGTDPKTVWFTTLNTTYESQYKYLTSNTPRMRQR
ncbi:hypothetical protein MNBD_ACTINO02-1595 [hydrothermal vent metagenome]|uniref:Uncharacterized protein n=1 Tax=hydrothermal vent metagenome TaxID=652676 RepID=A0A3B0RE71_9ZZZZ